MKVVDVAEFYSEQGGGVRTYIQGKMRAGAKKGHEVVVVAPGLDDLEEEKYGGRIIWIKGPPMPFDPRYGVMWNQKAVHRILDREKPDVVEGSSPWTGGQFAGRWRGDALKTFIFHQDPVAVFPHTFLDRFFKRRNIDAAFAPFWAYLRNLSKKFDATMVSGDWLAERLDEFGLQRPIAVPFGIDKSCFSADKADPEMRKALLKRCDLDEDAALFIMVSRFHPEKRLGVVFDAMAEIQKSRPAGLVVFGSGFISNRVRRKAERNPHICLAGFTKDREELAIAYASADAMLHGSAAETFGLGVAEAICSGLPVIAPSVGGAADLVDDHSGLLYEPGRVKDCAQAALTLLETPRQDLREGCTRRALTINSVDAHFDGLFARYEALLAGGNLD